MSFTALHRVLGEAPSPLTDDLLDAAVAAQTAETDDLDWKSELPPAKGLTQTDFPKDVAAMANSGGGLIIYGVTETAKIATGRVDVGECDEPYERSLRSAAITAISPPVFGLAVHLVGPAGRRAVVVEVPASVDGPHLIYRNDYFGAPVRNGSDTVWMKERQIEAMYRARFDERRHAAEALDSLVDEAAAGRDTNRRAWVIAVAHPRIPRIGERLSRDVARGVLVSAAKLTLTYASRYGAHPLESVDQLNPRPGLRRWVARDSATSDGCPWKESWVSIHHDGSVTVTAAVGGHRVGHDRYSDGWEVASPAVEAAIADLMALVRATAQATGNDEYDVRVTVHWAGDQPLAILTQGNFLIDENPSIPLHRFTPVEVTVNAAESDLDYHRHVYGLAEDCVNQGGVAPILLLPPPESDDQLI